MPRETQREGAPWQHEVAVFVAQRWSQYLAPCWPSRFTAMPASRSRRCLADSDAVDRAHDLADTVGGPRARFGNDECPVGGKEAVDGEE